MSICGNIVLIGGLIMSKKVKTSAKIFTSDLNRLEKTIVTTVDKIANIVGCSLGPGGRNVIIESDLPGIPNKNTKDGVSIFKSLGANDPHEHLIIEQMRDVAVRTVNEAGDGTTTATVISSAFIKNIFNFCKNNRKFSPQKITRIINNMLHDDMLPYIEKNSIKINSKNQGLLEKVATISANGDKEMAKAVMEAFEMVGYGSSSHVTIQEISGPHGYQVKLIEGFPITKGYEESIGKFHSAFINDQANQRCTLEKPLFVLFDGKINDIVQIQDILGKIGEEYVSGKSDFKNVVIVAHSFADSVLTNLSFNFPNPNTINVVPLSTPLSPIANAELEFLMDVSAFTGAKIFNMNNPLSDAEPTDFGQNMERIEIYRFRTTIVGDSDPMNIELRVDQLKKQSQTSESKIEKLILEERIGKLTNGIAQLKILGSSNGELKERSDRAEDAVCAVRSAITRGCLPGGCRILINMALDLQDKYKDDSIVNEILVPSLFEPFMKLLQNAGYNEEEIEELLEKMINDKKSVYDVENQIFGDPKELGLFDATLAVEQALKNAVSISSVMGTLGGIVAFPRDKQLEDQFARDEANFERTLENAPNIRNEADYRA
jgi:chaperonin GroEL